MPRITHILCPVDLSGGSRAAISRALKLRRATGARLTILSVLPPVPQDLAAFRELTPDGAADLADEAITGRVRGESGVVVLTSEAPDAGIEIAAQADHLSVELIVMGRNGRSALERMFLGSVASDVIRRASVPVLVVPPGPVAASVDDTPEILCAVDFSDGSRAALAQAIDLSGVLGHRLAVLHVVPPLVVADADMVLPPEALQVLAAGERDAASELTAFVASAGAPHPSAVEIVRTGAAPVEILATAAERHAWVTVVGTHGRSAMQRRLFGSTTDRVVREARCAVMTVPALTWATVAA